MGEYSIADIAVFPWLRVLTLVYKITDQLDWNGLENVPAYLDRCLARETVKRAVRIPPRP